MQCFVFKDHLMVDRVGNSRVNWGREYPEDGRGTEKVLEVSMGRVNEGAREQKVLEGV